MSFRPTSDQRSEAVVPAPTLARERSGPDTTWRFGGEVVELDAYHWVVEDRVETYTAEVSRFLTE